MHCTVHGLSSVHEALSAHQGRLQQLRAACVRLSAGIKKVDSRSERLVIQEGLCASVQSWNQGGLQTKKLRSLAQ